METYINLQKTLSRIDGKGYKAYKDIMGSYDFELFTLHIDHVQGDPFAAPSKLRVRVAMNVAGFPGYLYESKIRKTALEDFIARQVRRIMGRVVRGGRGMGKSGLIAVDAGGQEVLERTACRVTPEWVEIRLQAGLPARGRTILGRQAESMLCKEIPEIGKQTLFWNHLPHQKTQIFVECVENQEHIRSQLDALGLVAFVAEDSLLPRESGASDRPLSRERAVLFRSPDSLRITLDLPNPISPDSPKKSISGMGIPRGITLIVGGGYHGKSTLLRALERGVYPHVPGDGREYVITNPTAVKIRAEDGRRVEQVDISAFINNLPNGAGTTAFSSPNASGSTSQAANIIEAVEIGSRLLLLDEDTSATNFMVRDARMQALVHKEDEPITPFVDRIRELYEKMGVSTILVMGGSGDYLDAADHVIAMRNYLPYEITVAAREVARSHPTRRHTEQGKPLQEIKSRIPLAGSFNPSRGKKEVKIDAKGLHVILFGRDPIELRSVEQLVDISQTRAIGNAIYLAAQKFMNDRRTLQEVVNLLEQLLEEQGPDILDPFRRGERHPGNFARPRRFEIAAAINRLRTVKMRQV